MAKVLEALERARQERERRAGETGAGQPGVQPAAGTGADPGMAAVEMAPGETDEVFPADPAAEDSYAPNASHSHQPISDAVIGAHDSQSPIAEQLRQIRTNLETVLAEYRSRALVITSPVSGDGKTLVTANLSVVLADHPNQQVILIDADMRKPDQHRLFNCKPAPGLSDYLRGRCSLEQAIHPTAIPNLKIIPAGHPPSKPTVLLSSDRMTAMMGELQRHFQWIIFDTPPILPVTDASVLARECIGLILVVRMGQTHRKTIMRAQDLLAEMRLPVLGCILNDFTSTARENNYYYRYYHSEQKKKTTVQGGFKA